MQDLGNSPIQLSYSYSADIWPALITLTLTICLGWYCWRRRHIPAAKPFIIACLLGGCWTFGVILELLAVSFSTKVFWVKFQAIWQLPIGATMTCFVLQYAGLGRWLTRRSYALLFLIPFISVLFIVTNDVHHLIWTEFRMERYVSVSSGRLYWFFHSYIYILGIVNFAVLVWLAISSPKQRLPVAIIVSGQIIGRIGYALDKLGTDLIGPGETVLLTIGVVGVAYAVALLRYHAIDPVAAAQKAVLLQMHEGFFVLDLQGRIVDVNPMAASILGLPEGSLREKRLTEIMPIDGGLKDQLDNQGEGQTVIILGKGKSARHYHLKLTPLRERHGEFIGLLLLLYDVTEQKRAQSRILEEKTLVATLKERERLAHEIHDGIEQILGYVVIQAQMALKYLDDGNKEKAGSLLRRLVEMTKDAHGDIRESIFSLKAGKGPEWSLIPALKEYFDRFQSNYGIRTELTLSDGVRENTLDPLVEVQLFRVIQEALTNSRKYSGAHNLKITVEPNGSRAYITITDDGPGLNAGQLEYSDGSHLGLIFMRERMEQIGGTLKTESIPGGGTVLKLDVPIRKQREGTQ